MVKIRGNQQAAFRLSGNVYSCPDFYDRSVDIRNYWNGPYMGDGSGSGERTFQGQIDYINTCRHLILTRAPPTLTSMTGKLIPQIS